MGRVGIERHQERYRRYTEYERQMVYGGDERGIGLH